MDLHEYLEEQQKATDYIPPYGTQLTVRDFSPAVFGSGMGGLSVDAYSTGGKRSRYDLEVVNPDDDGQITAVCRRDGEAMEYIHPWVHRNHGVESLLAAWYDWVLTQDAGHRPGALTPEHPWEGDSVDAQLYRAEHGVVTYEDFHTNSSNASSVGWLQQWFDEKSQDSPVCFNVYGVTDAEDVTASSPLTLRCMGFKNGEETLTTKTLGKIEALPPYTEDISNTSCGLPAQYGLHLVMDGPAVESFHGDWLPLTDDLSDYLTDDPLAQPTWFVVIAQGLNAALLIPARYAVITLHLDNDGAFVRLSVRGDAVVGPKARQEQRYRRRWGRWLDQNVQLTDQELTTGLKQVTEAMEELREAEWAETWNGEGQR